jgi:TPR repeat protein
MAFATSLAAHAAAHAAPRVALVIGNDHYVNLPPDKQLTRAVSDAQAVADKLGGMGFKVVLRKDASLGDMLGAIDEAVRAVDPGGVVVVYFAGHGVEIEQTSYLLPKDSPGATGPSPGLLTHASVSLGELIAKLNKAGGRINVVILDACRDNPYRDSQGRSIGEERGLKRADPPPGFFLLYSASAGQTALDRLSTDPDPIASAGKASRSKPVAGLHSVYTRRLLAHMSDPVSLIDLAKTLQEEVSDLARKDDHDQTPDYADHVMGRPTLAGETAVAADELEYWRASHCAEGDLEGCRTYQAKFGAGGRFADLATLKLRPAAASPPPSSPAPDPNAAARAAIDGIPVADWSSKSGNDLLTAVLARVTLPQIKTLANAGDGRAQTMVGTAFYFGRGGEAENYAQAMIWYRKAADQGYARAQHNIGVLYALGHGVKQDYVQAMTWYRKAADQGDAWAQTNIGVLYELGHGVKQDYAQAMTWYRKAADQGDARAQTNIGALYDNGDGVKQDYAQAMTWYRKAADQGYAAAQNEIGFLYEDGHGVARDYAQAAIWYRKAATQGDAVGQFKIGLLYDTGQGVAQDYAQAMDWFRKAADQGYAAAQNEIGFLYEDGHGVARDYAQAAIWYRKAATQGDAVGQFKIGFLYDTGQGVAQDYAQAMDWFRKAAEQRNAEQATELDEAARTSAQYDVGALYANGQGVPKDEAQARVWFARAAAGGNEDAKQWLAAHGG